MPVSDVVSRQHLRSASRQLVVPRHRLSTFGRRAFAVAGPMFWNSLPNSLRESACDDNISDDFFEHFSLVDIDVQSAVEVLTTLRYIKVQLYIYLLTAWGRGIKKLEKNRRTPLDSTRPNVTR